MSKIFIIEGHEVEFTPCTAIAASIGDTARQENCVFVHDLQDEFGNGDGVIFGVEMPESSEQAADIMSNEELDTYQETLNTVEFKETRR